MTTRGTNPAHLSFPGMSQAHRTGDIIEISGQVALREDGSKVEATDARGQAEQCFRNLEAALRTAGAELSDVAQLTCYLTSASDFGDYAAVKKELFGTDPPASTTVVVSALLDPAFIIEISATAYLRPASKGLIQ